MDKIKGLTKVKCQKVYLFITFTFCLSSFYFYEPVFLHEQGLKLAYWVLLGFLFVFSVKPLLYHPDSSLKFINPLRFLLVSMLLSTLSPMFFWGQGFSLSLRAMFPYMGFILYFFLLVTNPPARRIVQLIWLLAILYVVVYSYSLLQAPDIVFGSFKDKDVDFSRGFARLFVPGRGFLFLAFFISVNNYVCRKRQFWLWVTLGLSLIILAHLIRQYILFSFVLAGAAILSKTSLWKKAVLILLSISVGYYAYLTSPIVQSLIALTEAQLFNETSGENIRLTAYQFFFTEFSSNTFSSILGNGVPHYHSLYGNYYTDVVNGQKELFLSDVGYAQIFAQFGVLGMISIVFVFYNSFMVSVPNQYKYLKLFMVFVFLSTFMSGYFLSNNNLAAIAMAMYLIEVVKEKKSGAILIDKAL